MRLLLANKYFFPNGGTEIYLRILLDELPKLGHECVPFAVAYQGDWPSPYAKYFLPSPAGPGAPRLEQMRLTPGRMLALLDRSIYSLAAQKCLRRLLDETGPVDAALVINIYNYMSPSILPVLTRRGAPIAMLVGDYNLMCPSYQFLRDNKPCFLCQKGAYANGLRYRCVKGSLAASAVRVVSMYVQRLLGLWNLVDLFLTPCAFMRERLAEAGIPEKKLRLVRYPVRAVVRDTPEPKGNYLLSFGRISAEKGLDVLIDAYQMAAPDADLVVLGRDYDGELGRLKARIRPEFASRIRFPGFASGDELSRIISGAQLTVVPSRWHDNAPLSVYESMLHGTPVAGAAMGGIPEQIRDGVDGALFAPESASDLAGTLTRLLADRERLAAMGRAGRERVLAQNDPAAHAAALADILASLAEGKNR
ncbi:MAG: glycosyltransferase [Desulfovibrionaceae bacterium]|nr:glycosyltransferase [Desulfovibrionaceae bacterium]MBF0513148.1 glycosyltransferase [Desulfovibrionaceae bacterium]